MNVGCIGVEWTTSWRIREHNWCWCSKEVVSVGWTCTTIRIGSSTHCYHHPSMLQTFKKIRNSVQLQPSTKYTKFLNFITPSICLTLNICLFKKRCYFGPMQVDLLILKPPQVVSTHFDPRRQRRERYTYYGCIMMYYVFLTQKYTYIYMIIIYIICDYVSIYIYICIYWLLRVSNCSELHFDTVWPSLTWNLCVLCCCMFVSLLQCYLHNNSIFI